MAFIYESKYNHTATLGDKIIKFKPWNTKNEKDYLIAVETSEEGLSDATLFNILIKPCLENPDLELDINEQKILIIKIRESSIGSTFPIRFQCRECNNINEIEVPLEHVINYKPNTYGEITVEDVYIKFGIPTQIAKERLEKAENAVERSFTNMIIHIKEIEYKGEANETFTFEELHGFMESIPSNIFDEIFKQFLDMESSLEIKGEFACQVCNHTHKIEFDRIPNFLWI